MDVSNNIKHCAAAHTAHVLLHHLHQPVTTKANKPFTLAIKTHGLYIVTGCTITVQDRSTRLKKFLQYLEVTRFPGFAVSKNSTQTPKYKPTYFGLPNLCWLQSVEGQSILSLAAVLVGLCRYASGGAHTRRRLWNSKVVSCKSREGKTTY